MREIIISIPWGRGRGYKNAEKRITQRYSSNKLGIITCLFRRQCVQVVALITDVCSH